MRDIMQIHVTMHTDGTKMDGIQSISTSVLKNPICQARRKCPDSICAKCYANTLCKMRKNMEVHLAENFDKLSSRLLTRQEAALVPVSTLIARIESFGDVATVTQARNYIRIIRAHQCSRWGIWSKNWGIWHAAFLQDGKPRNCTFVLSSTELNHRADVPERMREYVDHVFTVWDRKTYDAMFKGGKTECAGIQCMKCQKCYKKRTSFYIDERLR